MMKEGTFGLIVIIGVILLGGLGESGAEKPNILFMISDDQRADTISALGNKRINTPNLDALVRRGVTFSRAVCANPICVASRAEILTGNSGFRNGIIPLPGLGKLQEGMPSWPRALMEAGFETCYVGKWHTTGRPSTWGYTDMIGLYSGGGGKWMKDQEDWKGFPVTGYRGWVFQTDDRKMFPEKGVGLTPDISSKFADAAIEFLEREHEKPFFLHVNFTAPHDPLFLPPGYEGVYKPEAMELPGNYMPEHPFDHGNYDGRDEALMPWPRTPGLVKEVLAMYYAVIDDMDKHIGRIMKALEASGELDNTIVVYTADHGMSVGSHGLRGKQNMYEHTVNVPLIVCGPGIPENEKSEAQVYLRELFPTTCELAGVPIPENVEGVSFAGILKGEEESARKEVFCYFRDSQRMVREDRWKLVYYPLIGKYQLFDIVNDPLELADQSEDARYGKTRDRLKEKLVKWRLGVNDPIREGLDL